MNTSRFAITNLAAGATLDLTHGGGARHDDASGVFPIERALNGDRRSVWKTDGTNNVVVVLDLGAVKSYDTIAFLGYRKIGSALTACAVDDSFSGAVFNVVSSSIPLTTPRDAGVILGSVRANRYIRFTFTNTGAFTLGRLFIGLAVDLLKAHTPGAEDTTFQNRLEQGLKSGSTNVNTLGDPGANITLSFMGLTGTARDQLRAVAAAPGSVVFVDPEDVVREVLIRGGQVKTTREFEDRYDCVMEATRLP